MYIKDVREYFPLRSTIYSFLDVGLQKAGVSMSPARLYAN